MDKAIERMGPRGEWMIPTSLEGAWMEWISQEIMDEARKSGLGTGNWLYTALTVA